MYALTLLPPGMLSPLLLALVMAGWDVFTRRIPNFLTFGGALAGIVYQTAVHGWPGLAASLSGLAVGLVLLLLPYVLGGMGAGDVKALAALGAWFGPAEILTVFCFMGLAGGLLSLAALLWTGRWWQFLRTGWISLVNFCLLRKPTHFTQEAKRLGEAQTPGIPYGVAIALGVVGYLKWGPLF